MSNSITSNGISDFKLTTECGQPITDRFCCKDDIIASWVVLNTTSDCSDNFNVGSINLTGEESTTTSTLKKDTSDHTFCFCSCHDFDAPETYILNFDRRCSDLSDTFSINLTRFKTKVDAGSDQHILFGDKLTLGSDYPNPYTIYRWNKKNNSDIYQSDFVSDRNILHTVVRPCHPGCNTYEVHAHDSDFPECKDFDCIDIHVSTPIIFWSDIQQSDGGSTCMFSATLLSSDTYTDQFHITFENCSTGSDLSDFYASTPYFFTYTVQKPTVPGAIPYKLKAALSDFEDCCNAVETEQFLCIKPVVTLPGGPSTFEMLFKLFGFLLLFILLGLSFA
jgi:hypothetical protein